MVHNSTKGQTFLINIRKYKDELKSFFINLQGDSHIRLETAMICWCLDSNVLRYRVFIKFLIETIFNQINNYKFLSVLAICWTDNKQKLCNKLISQVLLCPVLCFYFLLFKVRFFFPKWRLSQKVALINLGFY